MSSSRWLLLLGAVKRCIRLIFAICRVLTESGGDKGVGRLRQLTNIRLLHMMHLIVDAYTPLARFNTLHQSTNMTISQASRSWAYVLAQINALLVSISGSLRSNVLFKLYTMGLAQTYKRLLHLLRRTYPAALLRCRLF